MSLSYSVIVRQVRRHPSQHPQELWQIKNKEKCKIVILNISHTKMAARGGHICKYFKKWACPTVIVRQVRRHPSRHTQESWQIATKEKCKVIMNMYTDNNIFYNSYILHDRQR